MMKSTGSANAIGVQGPALRDETCIEAAQLRKMARAHWAAERSDAALAAAWAAYETQAEDRDGRALLARLLHRYPDRVGREKKGALLGLLRHPQVDPDDISLAGWHVIRSADSRWTDPRDDADLAALAAFIDEDDLARALLEESPVADRAVERALTRLRRWLLLTGQWQDFPRVLAALGAQAALNGGAWPFDATERASLAGAGGAIVATYLPEASSPTAPVPYGDAHAVTQAVRQMYEGWPFPPWRRITVASGVSLADEVRRLDPDGPASIPNDASVLVAGCGTGREAALVALAYPQTRVTAIDLSAANIDHARRRCAAIGATNIRFQRLDLHDCAQLGERFDAIFCSGVLHCLPDPEAGWSALAAILRPGGVMKIMVYSRIARFQATAARSVIADLLAEPVDDDLLRRVRHRIMDRPDHAAASLIMRTQIFSTLAGTYVVLVRPHEDPFDVARIAQALDRIGLRMTAFVLRSPDAIARYAAQNPHDPLHRDMAAWARFEKNELRRHAGEYVFMCRKPAD
jgi:SAM-dependent methyltransferase